MAKRRSSCRKIGLFGGTFNPVHNGHLAMAEWAMEHAGLDEIWLLPNYIPPHKEAVKIDEIADDRLKMLELAVKERPGWRIETIELQRKGRSYTYETVRELHERYPHYRFVFLIGADSLLDFEHWVKPRQILRFCTLMVAKRSDARMDTLDACVRHIRGKYKTTVTVLEMPLIDLSSTEIRNRVKEGLPIDDMVPRSVAEYITQHGLYPKE